VLGAFKATPTGQLETEAYVPPLDLWLNGRIARSQARLERTGIAMKIKGACTAIRIQLRTRRQSQRQRQQPIPATLETIRKQWVEKWISQPIEKWSEREKLKVLADWTDRWKAGLRRLERVVQPGTDPGTNPGGQAIPEDTPPNKAVLKLQKAESSVLSQARTGRIGLARFLYNRKVPGIQSAQRRRRAREETPHHMELYCTKEVGRRLSLRTNGRVNCQQLIETASGAKRLARWLICSGCLGQFSLAKSLPYN